jgi:hypothetical protein
MRQGPMSPPLKENNLVDISISSVTHNFQFDGKPRVS